MEMRTFTPEDYVPIFKQFGVTMVIRLNKKAYEGSRFTKNGIKHEEIYFLDGSTPTDVISSNHLRNKFLNSLICVRRRRVPLLFTARLGWVVLGP